MDEWDFNFDYEHNMDGEWNNSKEFEVYLTTYDGAQHLRLHGWLKKNEVLIKSEQIRGKGEDTFGTFDILVNNNMLEKLKEANYENGLFLDIEVTNTQAWNFFRPLGETDNKNNFFEKIQNIMLSFQAKNPEDIAKYVTEANETSLKLFKESNSFITDYIMTIEMTEEEKIKDLDIMIKSYEDLERYEDCAFLIKIKNKVIKHYKKIKNE